MKTTLAVGLALITACGSNAATECVDNDGDGVTVCDGDCNDDDPLQTPLGTEICGDGVDNNCDGDADGACGGLGTFVSALTGSDTNPGTKAEPVATIGAGLANAATIGGEQTVVVAEGTYAEKVSLAEGVDLLGGFQCDTASCTWLRSTGTHVSAITNNDYEGVVAGATVTAATLVDGFHITGLDGTPTAGGSCGVTLAGGSPTLRGNTIVGGNVTAGGFGMDRSIAVRIASTTDPAGALIDRNDLSGGTSIGLSVGVMFDSYPQRMNALATVSRNVIRGGAGRRSAGIVAWNSIDGTLVAENDITAGNSNGGASHGIEVGSIMTIDSNRINVDQAAVGTCMAPTQWCAGIMSESSTTVITNNIVFPAKSTRSAGIVLGEFEVPAGAVVVNGNTLNGGGIGPTSAARNQSAALVVTIGPCNTCGFNGFTGRIRNNILDGGINQERYGILEDPAMGKTMRPEVIENNLFWFAAQANRTDVLWRQVDAQAMPTDHTTDTAVNASTAPPAAGNLYTDPLLDATWHLAAGSPCIDKGTATEAPLTDFEGEARPAKGAVDIGHDEMP